MVTIFLAVVGGLLPAVVWLWFWLKEDEQKPEPAGYILQAFFIGGFAVLIAFFLERPLLLVFGELKNTYVSLAGFDLTTLPIILAQCSLILSWAAIEEIIKYLAARFTVFEHRAFDEPIDAMIYIITVALGFAAIENALFLFDALTHNGGQLYFLLTGQLRFLGATIVHVVSSSVTGAAVAFTFYKSPQVKAIIIPLGLLLAIVLHALFNFFIINNDGSNAFLVMAVLWIAALVVILLFERVKQITKPI